MKTDGLRAELEHRIAELRTRYPRISSCHAALEDWKEDGEPRHALRLEIRWPQHQSVVAGPACANPEAAMAAAFELAAQRVERRHA